MSITSSIKRLLYRRLSLTGYLRVLSGGFFAGLRLGLGRRSAAYEYPRFLKHIVRRDDTAIDIGANLGYYSRILSGLVGESGKLYAVEPVKPILSVLEHNLRRCHNVTILPYALGCEDKPIQMVNDSSRHTGYMGTGRNRVPEGTSSSTEPRQSPEAAQEKAREVTVGRNENGCQDLQFNVEMRRGSELFADLERLDFIKCDIEGYETIVIPELAPVIEKHLPVVLLETGGANRRPMIELFRRWGYAGYVLQNGRLISVMRAPDKDIVFIPGHRYEEFSKLIAR